MKIAVVVSHFPQVSETFILNRITGLIDLGHQVDIYAYEPGPSSKYHPLVEQYQLNKRTFYFHIPANYVYRVLKGFFLFFQHFFRSPGVLLRSLNVFRYGREALSLRLLYGAVPFIGQRDYDIIHSHHGPNGGKDTWLIEIGAVTGKHVTSFHGADATRHVTLYGKHVYDRLFAKGDHFLPVSEGMKAQLIALGCPESKITVHRSGIDCRKFSYREPRYSPEERLRILTVGRLVEKKGVEYGIRAVAKLIRNGLKAEYAIVGDGELKPDLIELCRRLDVTKDVLFLGDLNQDEVAAQYRRSHLFLAPSITARDGNREGIPNTVKEAMAAGLPVVASNSGDMKELIQNGETGFLVPEKDTDEMAAVLSDLARNPQKWSALCRRAREAVEKKYDVEMLNKRIVRLYRAVRGELDAHPDREPLKVLFVSHSSGFYGSERSLLSLVKGLRDLGEVQPAVLLPSEGPLADHFRRHRIEVNCIPFQRWIHERNRLAPAYHGWKTFTALGAADRFMREWSPDIIYSNSLASPFGSLLAWRHRIPHVWHIREFLQEDHGARLDWGMTLAKRWMRKSTKWFVCNSNAVYSKWHRVLETDSMEVVYNGLDGNDFAQGLACQEENSDPSPPVRLLILGSIQPGKGQHVAVDALAYLVRKGIQAKLSIVGRVENQTYFATLQSQIQRWGLEKQVSWGPFTENPLTVIRNSDMVLICSRMEAFGRVAVEAMAAGVPVIASANGGLPEIIEHQKTGLLFTPGDPQALQEQIEALIQDSAMRIKIIQNARELTLTKFSMEKYVASIMTIINGCRVEFTSRYSGRIRLE